MNWIKYYTDLKNKQVAQSEPLRSFPICPALRLPTVPFKLWAAIDRQIYDVMALKPYARCCLWWEYRIEMVYMGFEPESPTLFGLDPQ